MSVTLAANPLADQPPYVVGLLVLGIVLVSASMMLGLRNRQRKSGSAPSARDTLERAKQKDGLKRDLETLAVEIEALARRLGTQLDNKAARIERLLDEADTTLARLDQARSNLLTPSDTRTQAAPDRSEGADLTATAAPSSHAAPERSEGAGSSPDRLTADTYRLADAGMTAAEIAKSVGEHVGKIELILALRPSSNA